jgi:AraC family transcriptional regulator of adaptative response / DNA-3-methyladenine glycosylase II
VTRHPPPEPLTLRLAYRPPFDWAAMLAFLSARAPSGVEWIRAEEYLRTVRAGDRSGWLRVRQAPDERVLLVELTHSLAPELAGVLTRLGHLFDSSARPDVIAAHLRRDPLLAEAVARRPGLRVPGAFDGFELATRAVLGQQVTVKGATTLAGRFAEAFGGQVETPYWELRRACPTAERVAAADVGAIASLGITRARAATLVTLADEVASGRLALDAGGDAAAVVAQLIALPGIGPWTAQYVAMRALRWADAFPKEDVVLRKRLGGVTAAHAERLSQPWRPWRSYAVLHLWHACAEASIDSATDSAPEAHATETRPRRSGGRRSGVPDAHQGARARGGPAARLPSSPTRGPRR